MKNNFSLSDCTFPEDEKVVAEIPLIELQILGWILMRNEILDNLSFLSPAHFYIHEHAEIYRNMLELRIEEKPITPMSLENRIGGKLEITNGLRKYLMKAISESNAMLQPIQEAKMIIEEANKRAIKDLWETEKTEMQQSSTEGIVSRLISGMERILANGGELKFQTEKQITKAILDRLSAEQISYSTGIKKLDDAMNGGLMPGMCYLFAARKKIGKTMIASTISCNLSKAGIPHLFICAEMSAIEIHQRVIARLTESYTSSFRNSYGRSKTFKDKVQEQIDKSTNKAVYLSAPGITFDELRLAIAQAKAKYGIKGFILDSLQLVGGKSERKSTAEHQDEIAQWCADYGRQKDLFSIITAQINQTGNIRGGEGARLACDQAYELHAPEGDPSRSDRWMEMIETRYTQWANIGSKESPALLMHEFGQYFYQSGEEG